MDFVQTFPDPLPPPYLVYQNSFNTSLDLGKPPFPPFRQYPFFHFIFLNDDLPKIMVLDQEHNV